MAQHMVHQNNRQHGFGNRRSPDPHAGVVTAPGGEGRVPALEIGRLLFGSDDGMVYCCDRSTGEEIWRERVGGAFFGSPVWVDERLYCIAKNGEVVVLADLERRTGLAVKRVEVGSINLAKKRAELKIYYDETSEDNGRYLPFIEALADIEETRRRAKHKQR